MSSIAMEHTAMKPITAASGSQRRQPVFRPLAETGGAASEMSENGERPEEGSAEEGREEEEEGAEEGGADEEGEVADTASDG
jgi:hypothetical protein